MIHLMLCVFFLWCFFFLSVVVVLFFFLRYVQNENAHTCHLFMDG